MYKILLAFLCLCYVQVLTAQTNAPAFSNTKDTLVMDIREKLVQLALQNPNYEVADRKVAVANYQVRKSKGAWLGNISAAGNFNEYSFKKDGPAGANLFPKYNFGINIPMDVFTSKSNDVKIARENLSIAEAEKNQKFREIRADVLIKYEDFLMHKQKLEFQSQVTQDARTAFELKEKDFSDGIIDQVEYSRYYKSYSDELSKKTETQRNYNVAKIELEKLIGVSLESVLGAR